MKNPTRRVRKSSVSWRTLTTNVKRRTSVSWRPLMRVLRKNMICQNCRPWFSTGRSSEKFIQVLNNISDTLNSDFFFINELKCVNTDIGKGTLMYIIIHHYFWSTFSRFDGDRGQLFSSSILPIVPSKPFNVIVQFSHFSLICPLSLNSLKKKNLKTLTSSLNVTIAHILDMEGA